MKIVSQNFNTFNNLKKILILFVVIIFCANLSHAQNNDLNVKRDTLLVGLAGNEPFVFNDEVKGIAVEIWNEIAEKEAWNFKYVPFDDVENALSSLNKGDLDLVVGPISITAKRLEHMRFSQPFYNSSISIISRVDDKNFWQLIKPFFSLKLLTAIGIFLIILSIVGTLFWLAERKESSHQFSEEPLKGIGTGMWLAIVTMSTTGYGDKAPETLMGRVLAGAWMIISIIFATSMVAGIASTLTLSSLGTTTYSSIEELSGRKVASITDSPSEEFLHKTSIEAFGVANLNDAISELQNKKVDAVIYDRPQLLFYSKNHTNEDLYISKAEYYKQGYGFAFSVNSPLIANVNRALLELAENQQIEDIIHSYIQKDE